MKTHPHLEVVKSNLRAHPKTWLVTGAAGFIGSHLVENLLRLEQNVIGFDNFVASSMDNLNDVRRQIETTDMPNVWSKFKMIKADIRDLGSCREAMERVDIVLHHAALGSVPRSVLDPFLTHENNATGFLNVLLAARDAKVERVIYASSSSVYGDLEDAVKTEARIGSPLSPYAASKLDNEIWAQVFALNYSMKCIGLRYFNVFGPRQSPQGQYAAVIPRWLSELAVGAQTEIYGDGSTSRDFCFIDNVVQMNLLAATASVEPGQSLILNTACHRSTTLLQLHQMLTAEMKSHRPHVEYRAVKFLPWRQGDVRNSLASIELAEKKLRYQALETVDSGIAQTVSWYLESLKS